MAVVLAMNDGGRRHVYPSRVRFEIAESDLDSYRRAADFLNVNQVDVLSVQHEYGIFGGKAGAHVLTLLRELRMPIVTTLHTVLSAPNPAQRAVIEELARLSDRLVVMSASGADLLRRVHGISDDQIDLIPHGIPHVAVDPLSKERLGVDGKTVILTFGLLSRDKGIEHVIDALPAILAVHPDTIYIVLGATHPHVVEHEGEAYRLMLEARGQQLGVAGEHDLPQPVRQPGRADRVPLGDRHLHHAVPSAGTDHIGHAGLCRWRREGGDLDAVHLRPRAPR